MQSGHNRNLSYIQKKNKQINDCFDDPFSEISREEISLLNDSSSGICEFWGLNKLWINKTQQCKCNVVLNIKQTHNTNNLSNISNFNQMPLKKFDQKLKFGPKSAQKLLELTQSKKKLRRGITNFKGRFFISSIMS